MKVIIVEDELLVAETLCEIIESIGHEVVLVTDSLEEVTNAMSLKPQLAILDINLQKEISGIDVGSYLNTQNVPFVYLTANNEMSTLKKAAYTRPHSYITKPFTEMDIIALLEIVESFLSSKQTFPIKTNKGLMEILLNDIQYVKSNGAYIDIVCIDKTYIQRMSMQDFLDQASSQAFVRIHRSFVINKNKVQSQSASSLWVNGTELPISRTWKKELVSNN